VDSQNLVTATITVRVTASYDCPVYDCPDFDRVLRHVTREQQPRLFWHMFIFVKQLDGSTCHLVRAMEVRVGPDHIVLDGNPAAP